MKKHTKIIATIGPASSSALVLEKMMRAGMDAARLNCSHGTHDEHTQSIALIRQAERKVGRPIAIHADLGGPKIRTGVIPGGTPIDLRQGAEVVFAPEGQARGREIPVTYAKLASDVRRGERILIDDGKISVEVLKTSAGKVVARVIDGGPLRDHKGINLPGTSLSTSAITKKDELDLKFALRAGVDSIGVSFVQGAADITRVRTLMKRFGRIVPIVAKIERGIAVTRLDEIIAETDAVMVARGDLGVETPIEEVPILQKRIIAACAVARRPVIVATQMLESMIKDMRPTRAEVTDVSNAVFEGADAVMLSAETSVGCDPANAVETMARIVEASEVSDYLPHRDYVPEDSERTVAMATARAACFAAEEACARAILVFTMTGRSARMVSSQRPCVDIAAITSSDDIARRTAFYWGVTPVKIRAWRSIDSMIEAGVAAMKARKLLKPGDAIVTVCGTATVAGATNMIKVLRV
ncbi:MAG: pyruvate kinase [bacterium]